MSSLFSAVSRCYLSNGATLPRILSTGPQKGGVGKSTLARLLARELAQKRHARDDPPIWTPSRPPITAWASDRAEAGIEPGEAPFLAPDGRGRPGRALDRHPHRPDEGRSAARRAARTQPGRRGGSGIPDRLRAREDHPSAAPPSSLPRRPTRTSARPTTPCSTGICQSPPPTM